MALRVAPELDHAILAIQGPPGSGKTFTGARMIVELVRHGLRVGVTANSHAVIDKLLVDVVKAGFEASLPVGCVHKVSKKRGQATVIEESIDNAAVLARIVPGGNVVVGGTPWLWAREDARAVLDVLFVDEAGQMSLANVLACSQSAKSVVLLGDPQQLEQPQQGSHPDGADRSALQHLLGAEKTVPPGMGIFLAETWRLAPSICEFTSEVFYESRLHPKPELVRQRVVGTGVLDGAGLWVLPVNHDGNQGVSLEEVDAVADLVERLLVPTSGWIDAEGRHLPLRPADVLVVAPYNAQVAALSARLAPRGVRVGTVDKFQGQEAPVVIYSMATSSPEDAPRGMEFLCSLNRLNVATSRARCASVLVASPRLFTPECKTPRQMQLANALCRYAELARVVA